MLHNVVASSRIISRFWAIFETRTKCPIISMTRTGTATAIEAKSREVATKEILETETPVEMTGECDVLAAMVASITAMGPHRVRRGVDP
jgi:hypothetical protein